MLKEKFKARAPRIALPKAQGSETTPRVTKSGTPPW